MSQSSINGEEIFFDVAGSCASANAGREPSGNQASSDGATADVSNIPIDQPMTDDSAPHPHPAIHQENPVSAIFFPQDSDWKEIHLRSVPADQEQSISIEKTMPDVVELRGKDKTATTRQERIPRWSFHKPKGAAKMHALKKEHDDRLQEATTPVVNILQSNNVNAPDHAAEDVNSSPIITINKDSHYPYSQELDPHTKDAHSLQSDNKEVSALSLNSGDNHTMKSRIVPTVDTPIFQASVIEADTSADECIIVLTGRIDHDQFLELEHFFDKVIQKQTARLFCDVGGLLSISSSGWGLFVAEMQRLRKRGGDLLLCGLQGEVERSFKILDLDKLFLTARTVSEAMRIATPESGNLRPFPKVKDEEAKSFNDAEYLSLDEKIHHILGENPSIGIGGIRKLLKSESYGKTKISSWKLVSKLRSMNLGSKEERYRFFRSS